MMNSQKTNPLALRSLEASLDSGDPFSDCLLDRKKYAEILTKIVLTYHRGFVLALSSDWGTGKTFFVKRWKEYLKCPPVDTKHPPINTIYFNAWENDFDNNALIALLAELQVLETPRLTTDFKKVMSKAGIVMKSLTQALAKGFMKRYVDVEYIEDAVEAGVKGSIEVVEELVKEYNIKKSSIGEFRRVLKEFVENISGNKPLVIFIDELDRCRPDYAVEVLEAVKHLFNIDGIVFVLSIDKKHLASSIKGYYGSEHINTDEYLRRFIDLEYTLPEPSPVSFASSLFEKHRVDLLSKTTDFSNYLINIFGYYSYVFQPTLRKTEKIVIQMILSIKSLGVDYHKYIEALLLLLFIKMFNRDLYNEIKQSKFNAGIIGIKLYDFLFKPNTHLGVSEVSLEGFKLLLWMYTNTQTKCADVKFNISEDAQKYGTLYVAYKNSQDDINDAFQKYRTKYNNCFDDPRHHPTSARLINHIELLENFS